MGLKKYFDNQCATYEDFLRLKEKLRNQGYSFYGNYSLDARIYQEMLWHEDAVRGIARRLSDKAEGRNADGSLRFANMVEERTCYFEEHRQQALVRTTAYVDGKKVDTLVAFFVLDHPDKHESFLLEKEQLDVGKEKTEER